MKYRYKIKKKKIYWLLLTISAIQLGKYEINVGQKALNPVQDFFFIYIFCNIDKTIMSIFKAGS